MMNFLMTFFSLFYSSRKYSPVTSQLSLEKVDKLCYLGDTLYADGGCDSVSERRLMFQAQNRDTINSTLKVALSFKIIMTASVIRPCFSTRHQTCKTNTKTTACKTKTKTGFWSQTGLVLRPTISDHITDF